MGDYPHVTSILSYVGWNMAYLILFIFMIYLQKEDGIRFFTPISLIPIPLNIAQLLLYLQYGGYFNNIWQVSFSTAVICFCINNIFRYIFKKKKIENLRKPYIETVLLSYLVLEYIYWTSSCFEWPSTWLDPYTYASPLSMLSMVLLPVAVAKTYGGDKDKNNEFKEHMHDLFRPIYIIFILVSCIGGFLLAVWMKNTLTAGIGKVGNADPYSVIAVMLFVVSVVIILFTVTIILVVDTNQKTYESRILKDAKNDAEKSNAAKSEFLANMSHEIRTPINAVLGMNEMILRESLEARDMLPQQREEIIKIFSDICNYSGNIESAGNNLLSIINDILDFSKIEAGKMEIIESEYKLSSVLNDVSNMISFKAKSKELEFTADVDERLPDGLYGDEVRVRQIITNLLNNAVKYTQKGSVRLIVNELKSDDDNKIDLIVKVQDTGIGIKKEDISKLFNKFERVDLKKNSTVEGTGLGLAITTSLLDMMGGTIFVTSEYGQGSEFTVTIPQKIVSREPIGNFKEKFEKSISELKAPKERFSAPDAHILIVDDTIMNLTVAKGLLKNTFINIDTAISGEESIEMCNECKYDLILMDQRMPNMDGITAMHHIKDNAECINRTTPFICLTADAVSGAREKYLSEGFEDYITKPIDSRALMDAMLKYLPKEKIKPVICRSKSKEYNIDKEEKNEPEIKTAAQKNESKDTEKSELKDAGIKKSRHSFAFKYIDKETGLKYCDGDLNFYRSLLNDYVRESKNKALRIQEYYETQDWKNYCVQVHSLKSTSKMIGAVGLSEIALELEKASAEEEMETIYSKHLYLSAYYKSVVEEISRYLGI